MSDKVFSDATGARLRVLEEQARAEMKTIGDARNRLRTLVDEIEAVVENCDEALDSMKVALDTLSQHV